MITIELNQSQLAEMAGGSRQSVNQAIGSFASRGWLRTEGRRIVVTDVQSLRRRGEPADVASACSFLLGAGASFITGQLLVVDGGVTLTGGV